MARQSSVLRENETQANKIATKVMRVTFLIFILIYLMNVVGIFVVDNVIMTLAFIRGSMFLLLPTLFVNILKRDDNIIRYLNVICATLFVMILSTTLTFHVVVIYVYPIAIASLYFSKVLNIVATAMTVVAVSIGQILAFLLQTLPDDNFTEMDGVIIFGVVPRALVLIAVAAIFTMLTSRTASLLSNLLGAEAQKEMLDKMNQMRDNAAQTSDALVGMVAELSDIAETSWKANQSIATETDNLLAGSTENATAVENADQRMQDITVELSGLSQMNHKTSLLTDSISENTRENQKRMDDATDNMEQIYMSTSECKEIITKLGEESKEIIGIIETITKISNQTNILALNASIEAARAGEHGKGFVVVAEQIQKLSEQTKTAVESIGAIVREVVNNTENAVVAMEQNVTYTQNGMESIQKANESAILITSSNEELSVQIHQIDKAAEIIRIKSDEVAIAMKQISDNTLSNCNALEQVTMSTQNSSAGTQSLVEIVEQIKGLSAQLNSVVQR